MLMEGVFAAVTTPFYPDERIYFRKIEANMARYSRSLLAGMVVLGSTGEAVTLNDAETRDVLRASIEATAPDKVLIAGVGRESVRTTIETAEFAATLNYDAVVVRPPSYYAWPDFAGRSSSLLPQHRRPLAAPGCPLPHSQVRSDRDADRAHRRTGPAPKHHRHQGFERRRAADRERRLPQHKTLPGERFRLRRCLKQPRDA
jgi:hypothetical protein